MYDQRVALPSPILIRTSPFFGTLTLLTACAAPIDAAESSLANAEVTLEYPAVVSLGSCSASIVAHGVALTAAHCRTDGGRAPLYLHRPDGTITKIADATRWVSHPERTYFENDIAVVFFDPDASRRLAIEPIEVDWSAPRRNESIALVGHGGRHELIPLDYQKRAGDAVVSTIEARTFFAERTETGGVGACSGDSGGPGLRTHPHAAVIGITSHGSEPCGLRTRLQRIDIHKDWIAQTVRESQPHTYEPLLGTVFGKLTGIDRTGVARGWVCDPDRPEQSPLIALYYDGRWHIVEATSEHVEVANFCSGQPAHYFKHRIEDLERLCEATIIAAAWNISGTPGGSYRLLEDSGLKVPCEALHGHAPKGELSSITTLGSKTTVAGWATDPDSLSPVRIRIWEAKPAKKRSAYQVRAEQPRLVSLLGEAATNSDGFFTAQVPTPRWPNQLCAFAVNLGEGGADELIGCQRPLQ